MPLRGDALTQSVVSTIETQTKQPRRNRPRSHGATAKRRINEKMGLDVGSTLPRHAGKGSTKSRLGSTKRAVPKAKWSSPQLHKNQQNSVPTSPSMTHHHHHQSSSHAYAVHDTNGVSVPLDTSSSGNNHSASTGEPLLPLDTKLLELLLCLTPTMERRGQMLRVVQEVQHALRRVGLTVEIYGSLGTGLLIPTSDVDCVMVTLPESTQQPHSPHHRGTRMPPHLSNMLQMLSADSSFTQTERKRCLTSGVRIVANAMRGATPFNNVVAIAHAKVPIVKCMHRESHVKVDLSFERDGCATSSFLCTEFCKPGNELARALTVLVKAFVSHNGLDDPSMGGLGSFPTALMVLWYVRHEVAQRYPVELRGSLGVLFTGFLKYYGMDFDYARTGIDYVRGCTFMKPPARELFIVNPVKPGTNCAKAATRFATHVIPEFQEAARALCTLLEMSTSATTIEVALNRFFCNCVEETRDWRLVRRAASAFPKAPQHLWEVGSNMYIGGVLDR